MNDKSPAEIAKELCSTVVTAYPWTEEDDKKLLSMHREGRSAREISHALSRSRNAVLGRLHRIRKQFNGETPSLSSLSDIQYKEQTVRKIPRKSKQKVADSSPLVVKAKRGGFNTPPAKVLADRKKPKQEEEHPRPRGKIRGFLREVEANPNTLFADLKPGQCCYIVSGISNDPKSEDPYRYCGNPQFYKSFCYTHANVVYRNEFEGDAASIPGHAEV